MSNDKSSPKQKLQVCKQQQTACKLVNVVCAYNLLILDPKTMKLGTLTSHDKSSPKQKLQVCKQQQTAPGNVNLFMPTYNSLRLLPFLRCMLIFIRALCPNFIFCSFHTIHVNVVKKGKEKSK